MCVSLSVVILGITTYIPNLCARPWLNPYRYQMQLPIGNCSTFNWWCVLPFLFQLRPWHSRPICPAMAGLTLYSTRPPKWVDNAHYPSQALVDLDGSREQLAWFNGCTPSILDTLQLYTLLQGTKNKLGSVL